VIAIIWRYQVKPGSVAAFEQAYGSAGAWAELFATGAGYAGTELLRGSDGTYLTVDRWRTPGDFERFLAQHKTPYAALDAACEDWTLEETRLGVFETLP